MKRINPDKIIWTESSLQELERLFGEKIEFEIDELEEGLGGLDFPWPITIKGVVAETDVSGAVWVNLTIEFDEISGAGAYEVRMSATEEQDNYEMGVPRVSTWTGTELLEFEYGLNTFQYFYTTVDAVEVGDGNGLIVYGIDTVGASLSDVTSTDIYLEKISINSAMTVTGRALIGTVFPTNSRAVDVIFEKIGTDRYVLIIESERNNGAFPNAITDYIIRVINSVGTTFSEETLSVGFKYNSRPQISITGAGEIFIASVVDDMVYSYSVTGDVVSFVESTAMPTMTEPDNEYFYATVFDNYYAITELTPTNIKYHVTSRTGANLNGSWSAFQPDLSLDYRYLDDGHGYVKTDTDKVLMLGVRYEQVGEPELDAIVMFELSCVSGTISINEATVEPLIYKGSTLPYYTTGHSVSMTGQLKKIGSNSYMINYRIDETGGDIYNVKHIVKDPLGVSSSQSHENFYGMGPTTTNAFTELNGGDYYFATLSSGQTMVSYSLFGNYSEVYAPRTYYITKGFVIYDTIPESVL